MILGTGSDVVDTRRIEKTLRRFGGRFVRRCFTDAEIQKAEARRSGGADGATYAKRFAAKEACSKALGTGFSNGVYMRDISVVNDENGKPVLVLTGGALVRLRAITPHGQKAVIHLTMTDEPPIAQASVIIECLP